MVNQLERGAKTDDASDIAPISEHLGYLLRRCYIGVVDHFNRSVDGLDLRSTDFAVLSMVRQHRHIRPTRLGEMLDIKLGNLSPVLDRLEARGLLTRRRSSFDHRVIELQLSAAGRQLHARASQAVDGHLAAMAGLLGDAEFERLVALLRKLMLLIEPPPLETHALGRR